MYKRQPYTGVIGAAARAAAAATKNKRIGVIGTAATIRLSLIHI